MEKLIVSLERDGILCPVGSIRGESPSDACFAYAEEYRDRPDAAPISLSLPLQEEAFTPTQTKNFFEGLSVHSARLRAGGSGGALHHSRKGGERGFL